MAMTSSRSKQTVFATSIRSHPMMFALVAVATGTLAACAGSQGPRQVRAENPTVTYTYKTDQELVQASQSAAAYCAQYQSVQRTARITNNADGTNTVVFDCLKTTATVPAPGPVVAAPPVNPGMTYTYRTDQELLDASRNAEAYCMRYGTPMTSTMVTNPNGTKTVTFQCSPR
jgi:hypothetical protein